MNGEGGEIDGGAGGMDKGAKGQQGQSMEQMAGRNHLNTDSISSAY